MTLPRAWTSVSLSSRMIVVLSRIAAHNAPYSTDAGEDRESGCRLWHEVRKGLEVHSLHSVTYWGTDKGQLVAGFMAA